MNAVIYARYSSDGQREESIEGQLRECKEYAERKGLTLIGSYIDRAISGRPEPSAPADYARGWPRHRRMRLGDDGECVEVRGPLAFRHVLRARAEDEGVGGVVA
jgi:hypothetical protein